MYQGGSDRADLHGQGRLSSLNSSRAVKFRSSELRRRVNQCSIQQHSSEYYGTYASCGYQHFTRHICGEHLLFYNRSRMLSFRTLLMCGRIVFLDCAWG